MFKGIRFDESDGHQYRQMKKFRMKIIEKEPLTQLSEELAFGLLSTGKVADVRSLATY